MPGGTAAANRPPSKAVFENGAVAYYEVRPDVFDSLDVWARQRSLLFDEIKVLKEIVRQDSALALLHDQIVANLKQQVTIEQRRGDTYREVVEQKRGTLLQRFWEEAKFPLGVAVGAFVAAQTIRKVQ